MHYELSVPLGPKTIHVGFESRYEPHEPMASYVLNEAAKYAFGHMQVQVRETLTFNQDQSVNCYRALKRSEWLQVVRENHETFVTIGCELNHVGTRLTVTTIEFEKKISQTPEGAIDLVAIDFEVERDLLIARYKEVAEKLHIHSALETLIDRSKDFNNQLFFIFKE